MAVTSYFTLKTEVLAYMTRTSLTSEVDIWIDFAEAHFNRVLRMAQMEAETDLTTDSDGNATLPGDLLAPRSVRRIGSPNYELIPVSMGGENRLSPFDTSGIARWYSISGTTLRVTPIEAGTMRLTYYQKIPALTDANTTNWLLDLSPDVYFYMTLAHGYAYAREMDTAGLFRNHADTVLAELGGLDEQARYHNAQVVLDGMVA